MLPEFANGPALPAAARFWAAFVRSDQLWEMLADIGSHRRARALEVVTASQFIGHESEIQRLAVRDKLGQEIVNGFGPRFFVVAARGSQLESCAVLEPLMAQLIEAGRTDHEALGRSEGIEGAVVEGAENLLSEESRNTVSKLLFFIAARLAHWGRCPQAPEV
jgi:hypothetical protein